MPVRSIPKNHIAVTGRHAADKAIGHADFESPLENEYLTLLDFDPQVEKYDVQPVRVPVPGVPRGYVPDVLVQFLPGPDGVGRPHELTEIKTEEDFRKHAAAYAPKFAAAAEFARGKGWVFVLKSDKDIRTPRLKNLKFLRAYRRVCPDPDMVSRLLSALAGMCPTATPHQLLDAVSESDEGRSQMLTVLWHLVLMGRIAADWDAPFDHGMSLWLPGSPR